MRFLALGDSYTLGEGLAADRSWPVQLAARLRDTGVAVADPVILATTGWSTGDLRAALDACALPPTWMLVTLLIGVNDQYRGADVGKYAAGFRTLLKRAVALAGGDAARTIVVSIPDWGVTPFARRGGRDATQVQREIDAFNAAARAQVARAHAHWVDVTPVSRAPEVRAELVADGLHPNGAQYARWVDAILPVAQDVLGVAGQGSVAGKRTA